MSTTPREERCLREIVRRLQQITMANGYQTDAGLRVYLDPPDNHGDQGDYPRIDVLTGDTAPAQEWNRSHGMVELPVTIAGFDRVPHPLTESEDAVDIALAARTAGGRVWLDIMRALFEPSGGLEDDLDANASAFRYTSHAIHPHDDGGRIAAALIDTTVEYMLHANAPGK
jgi:hypothetical protein